MSAPFNRRSSPPRSPPPYYNGRSHSPGRHPPAWKSSRRPPLDVRAVFRIGGFIIFVIVVLCLIIGALPEHDTPPDPFQVDRGPSKNHFDDFEGDLDCKLSSRDLYLPPLTTSNSKKGSGYCETRAELLKAMSGGGRYGFDTPYGPNGCHFKWFTPIEICMILERFDAVVFIGDDLVGSVYGAFNMLLRRNLKFGALEQWRMEPKEVEHCKCRKQFTNQDCHKYFIKASQDVQKHDSEAGHRSPYACNRIPHYYFPIAGPAPVASTNKFRDILAQDPHSWKPIAIIHSLGLGAGFGWAIAVDSMDEWLTIADASGRNTPFLWMGPNAAGHLKMPSRIVQEGNNALWHYSVNMAHEAKRRGVESLNSYNLTLQASSWDGSNYDERVALVQAMMIVNWMAKLESV